MPRLVLLLAVIAVFYILLKRVQGLPPHRRRAETTKIAIGAAVVAVVILTLAGKMHWVGAALTGLLVIMRQSLPLLLRVFPMLAQWRQQRAQAGSGKSSTVTTRILAMYLNHESGALSGEVLQGPFAQWRLDEMDRGQLDDLREYCLREDPESVQLLDSYLEQRFPDEEPAAAGSTGGNVDGGSMNRREAMQILGIDDEASRDEIVAAHRKLMQKLHPDRGGSDYLAAKINEAKDFLLGQS
ncbi:MAG: DnaJ domain-containing protein [Chromatocurvus sp.]